MLGHQNCHLVKCQDFKNPNWLACIVSWVLCRTCSCRLSGTYCLLPFQASFLPQHYISLVGFEPYIGLQFLLYLLCENVTRKGGLPFSLLFGGHMHRQLSLGDNKVHQFFLGNFLLGQKITFLHQLGSFFPWDVFQNKSNHQTCLGESFCGVLNASRFL